MNTFITSTPKGVEGHGISYGDEIRLHQLLIGLLPSNWTVHFSWEQILFADVQYALDKKKKEVHIMYNQNLAYWTKKVAPEIAEKVKDLLKK